MYGTAAALITSPSGDVLLVKPNYRELWSLPGGVLEDGEPPHVGCAREVLEELGLSVPVGARLARARRGPRRGAGAESRWSRSCSTAACWRMSRPSWSRNRNSTDTAS